MKHLWWQVIVVVFVLLIKRAETFKCDFQLTYESKHPDPNYLYGNIHLLSNDDIHSMVLEITFDKAVKFFQIWDGDLAYMDAKTFIILNDDFVLTANMPKTIQFVVINEPNQMISKPTKIWFNHRKVCIEDLGKEMEPVIAREITVARMSLKEKLPRKGENSHDHIILKIQFPSASDKDVHDEISPPTPPIRFTCPTVFLFEPRDPNSDQRSGDIILYSQVDVHGIRLEITFDKPILKLQSWLGEAVESSRPSTYFIDNPTFALKAHTPKPVRFYVIYNRVITRLVYPFLWKNITEPPSELLEIRLNNEQVCMRDGNGSSHLRTHIIAEPAVTKNAFQLMPPKSETKLATLYDIIFEEDLKQFVPNHTDRILYKEVADVCSSTTDTEKGKFPWHASIYHTLNNALDYLCAASLISKQYVVTVAHCLRQNNSQMLLDPENIVVYLGELHLDIQTGRHDVSHIIPHPNFDVETYSSDLALLKLSNPISFTDTVKPVCLWKNVAAAGFNEAGAVVGRVIDKTGKLANKLIKSRMFMETSYVCVDFLARHLEKYALQKTFYGSCASKNLECVGNVGESMVYSRTTLNRNIEWQLQGLIMFGIALKHHTRCYGDYYTVFVDVSRYIDWIQRSMLN